MPENDAIRPLTDADRAWVRAWMRTRRCGRRPARAQAGDLAAGRALHPHPGRD